jgi:hypothetical protein
MTWAITIRVLDYLYDIIKAHGGEVIVETKDGQGAALIIQMPLQ